MVWEWSHAFRVITLDDAARRLEQFVVRRTRTPCVGTNPTSRIPSPGYDAALAGTVNLVSMPARLRSPSKPALSTAFE